MASENADKCGGVNSGSHHISSARVAALERRIRMMERQLRVHTARRVLTEPEQADEAQVESIRRAAYEMGRRDFRLEEALGSTRLEDTGYLIPDIASRITAAISSHTPPADNPTRPESSIAITVTPSTPTAGGEEATAGPSTRPQKHKMRKRKDNAKQKVVFVQHQKEREKPSTRQPNSIPKNPQPLPAAASPLTSPSPAAQQNPPPTLTKSPTSPPVPFKEDATE